MVQAPPQSTRQSRQLDALLSTRGKDLPAPRIGDPRSAANLISFSFGFPDPASLPAQQVAAATTRAMEKDGQWALQYGKVTGAPPLVDALIEKLRRDQGIDATPENVLITAGGSQAVQLVLDLLVDPGDTVVVEAPTWMGFLYALSNIHGKAVTAPIEEEGTDTVQLERTLARLRSDGIQPKLIYLIPNFQNPSGISTTVERRRRIVELARE
ncbi:MAG: aminotransferase class I/II-fold pyridoxal phosphate-dependent enzyme, partial [Thermomicrobiales bacterium]